MAVEQLVSSRIKLREVDFLPIHKLLNRDQSCEFIRHAHEMGKSVVLVEGTWDLTHAGHVQHIREAKKHGDLVILRLASVEYASRYKGKGRPIEEFRDLVVSEFENVDAVFVDDTAIDPDDIPQNAHILAQLNPDKMALEIEDERFEQKIRAADYAKHNLGSRIEPTIMVLPYVNSTTAIVNKVRTISE